MSNGLCEEKALRTGSRKEASVEGEVREDKGQMYPVGAEAVMGDEAGQGDGASQCSRGF